MIYIYIDESGDLGFSFKTKKSSSKYYTIAAIKIKKDDEHKKIRQKKLKKKYRRFDEFKFSNSNDTIRKAVLKEVAKLDIRIFSLTLFKKNLKSDYLKERPYALYNFLMKELFKRCFRGKLTVPIYIYFDRFLPEKNQEDFEDYIMWTYASKLRKTPIIQFFHENSKDNKAIQVVDFIAGAIQYKYAHSLKKNNEDYIKMIENKLNHREYFSNKK
ncbi:MAG: DUF3800 domain-containing protein [Thermoplasmatales archaeon]|nr:DUF3800 domain-containing protein [Thermoplasmatales archaeon]